ncbi:MAG: hypothetical protein KDD62_00280, partial [Bdellovibrionales bacterium]|nr:hypothetical protein [Bdellovibrionales bacterium]
MDDIGFKLTADNEDVVRAFQALLKQMESVEGGAEGIQDALDEAFGQGAVAVKDFNSKIDESIKKLAQQEKQAQAASEANKRFNSRLRDIIRSQSLFGRSIGDITDKLTSFKSLLGDLRGGLKSGGNGLKGFGKIAGNLAKAGGIGILIAAVGALIAAFKRTSEGAAFLEDKLAQISQVGKILADRLGFLGLSLKKLFSGDVQGAAEEFKKATQDISKEIREEVKAVQALKQAQRELAEQTRILNRDVAEQRRQIEQNKLLAEDETRSVKERTQAYIEAQAQQENIARSIEDNYDRQLEIERGYLELATEGTEERRKISERIIELEQEKAEAVGDAIGQQTELSNAFNALQKQIADEARARYEEEVKRIQALKDEYQKLLDVFNQEADNVFLESLTDAEKIIELRDRAIQELDNLKAAIQAKAAELGNDLPPDFEANFAKMVEAINEAAIEELKELREGLSEPLTALGNDLSEKVAEGAAEAVQAIVEDRISKSKETTLPFLEQFKADILNALGITEEEAQLVIDSFAGLFNAANELINANHEARLAQIDERIEASQMEVARLEENLAKQEQLEQQALGSSASAYRQALANENKILQEAQAERLEEEEKAARRRQRIAAIQQIAETTLAVARLASSEASKGIVGVAIAATAVAALFSLFA